MKPNRLEYEKKRLLDLTKEKIDDVHIQKVVGLTWLTHNSFEIVDVANPGVEPWVYVFIIFRDNQTRGFLIYFHPERPDIWRVGEAGIWKVVVTTEQYHLIRNKVISYLQGAVS